jgi:thioredoxin-related protein
VRVRNFFLAFAALASLAIVPFAGSNAAELLVIGNPRCPYCAAWEREIGRSYSNTKEGREAPLRRFDIEEERPERLGSIEDVHVTPTFILVDRNREIGRMVGYNGPQAFWGQLSSLLAKLHSNPKG